MADFLHPTEMNIIREAQKQRSRGAYIEATVLIDDLLISLAQQSISDGIKQPHAMVAVQLATILIHQGYIKRAYDILAQEHKAGNNKTRETILLNLMFTYVRLRMNDISFDVKAILDDTWRISLSRQWFGQYDETHVSWRSNSAISLPLCHVY
jgi:hypothetical protein